jgi:NADPH:quinone reductase-like Zn-dependent oxidoreductase
MERLALLVWLTAVAGVLAGSADDRPVAAPARFPKLPVPAGDMLTEGRVELGTRLSFDERGARSGKVACTSCQRGWRTLSAGVSAWTRWPADTDTLTPQKACCFAWSAIAPLALDVLQGEPWDATLDEPAHAATTARFNQGDHMNTANQLSMTAPAVRKTLAAASATPPMRAVVRRRYGTPEVLAFEELDRPAPGDGEVLVRVHAAGVSIGDHHVVTGMPYVIRLSPHGGLLRPRRPVPGTALSGRVEAVGANVTTVRPGDEVFGDAPSGAFAEYAIVPAARLAVKPANLSFEEAAASPWAVTPLQALRDAGGLRAGQKVLINGASGGVGTWAVQIAKALGAHVTAVCSSRNAEMVRGLGADIVVDYTKEDFVDGGARFDLVFDTIGNRPLADFRKVLKPAGTFVSCSGGDSSWGWLVRLAQMSLTSLVSGQKFKAFIVSPNRADLLALKDLIEAGKAKPVIERRYALSEVPAALLHVGQRRTRGQLVVRVAG